jgi:hypothetical protein
MEWTCHCVSSTKKNKELQFAGAVNSLYLSTDGSINVIKGDPFSIGGIYARNESILDRKFTNHTIKIEKGTCFYLFTDGYADQFGGEYRKKIGSQRLRDILIENHNLKMTKQKEIITREFEQWKGKNAQIDDVLVIGIRVQ